MEDGVIALIIIIALLIGGAIFLHSEGYNLNPVDNEPFAPSEDEGFESPGGGGSSPDGGDGTDENDQVDQGEPCTFPDSFDIPSRSWWFEGSGCPPEVDEFFDRADDVDCYNVESTGNPYEYRREITSWYDGVLEDEGWAEVDTTSGYVNREECWAWGTLRYCEYNDKGMIALFVFCPATTERTGNGVWGQAVGDWDYMKDRADEMEAIIDELTD